MASLGRGRRGHLSSRIPNVKLRPAPAPPEAGQGGNSSRRRPRVTERYDEVNMMDREHVRRLQDEEAVDDLNDPELAHSKTYLPFENQVISFTGITWEKPALTDKLRAMGVRAIHLDLTLDATALISWGHDSLKYERSVEYRIPIFRPDWIDHVHRLWLDGQQVPPIHSLVEYKLAPFQGLIVAVSGIEPPDVRQSVITKITELGGKYSPSLNRECTHLIVSNPKPNTASPLASAKVTWAIDVNAQAAEKRDLLKQETEYWKAQGLGGPDPETFMGGQWRGIKVVWEGWFWDCLNFRGRFKEHAWDVEQFPIPPRFEESYTYREQVRKAQQMEHSRLMVQAHQAMQAAMAPSEDRQPSDFDREPEELNMQDMEDLKGRPEELETAVIRKRPRESQSVGRMRSATGATGLVDDLIASVKQKPVDSVSGAESVVVKTESRAETTKTGSRSPSPGTTRKRARTAKASSQDAVTPDWAPPPIGLNAQVSRSRSSMINGSRDHAFDEAPAAGPSRLPAIPRPSSTATVSSVKAKESSVPASRQWSTASSTYDPTVFDGLKFTHQIEGPVEVFEDAVRGMGGALVPYEQWLEGEAVDYVVCRLMNPKPPDETYAKNSEVVTECWIERCLKERRLCSPDDSVVFRPLPKPMPIQGIGGQVIHLSGYDEENLYYLKRLIKALGAEFAAGLSKSKTTVLVSGRKWGLKLTKATEWNLPIVSEEWLYAMARSGILEPLNSFKIVQEPEPEQAVAANTSASLPPVTMKADKPPGLIRSRLGATGTMNLSTVSDAGSVFGLGSSITSPGDKSGNINSRPRNASGDASSRRLGLAPTEMDLGNLSSRSNPEHTSALEKTHLLPDGDVTMETASKSRSTSSSSQTSAPLRTDAPPADMGTAGTSKPKGHSDMQPPPARLAIAREKSDLSATGSTVIDPEIWAQLNQRPAPAEVSKPAPAFSRRNRTARPRSGSSERTVNPFLKAMNDNDRFQHLNSAEAEHEEAGAGDESMRVMYVDPKAEQERKKLLDAFQEKAPAVKKPRNRVL